MPVNYNKPLIIRDGRNGNWFWVDKEVWNDNRLSSSDKVVYGTLAYFANQKSQQSYPGIGELATFSGITPRQVYRSIKKLEELQHIHIQRTHGKENHYTLLDNGINHLKEQRGDNMSGVTEIPQRGDNKGVGGVTNKHYEQYIYNKNNNNISPIIPLKGLNSLTDEYLEEISGRYEVSLGLVKYARERLINYCQANGKKYKDYKAALRNFVLGEMKKQVDKPIGRGGVLDATNI